MNDKADTTGTGPLLLSAAMLAKKLGVSERHVYKLRSDGRIPRSGKLGASVRWSAAEIAAWIEAGMPSLARWETMRE